ncbi:polysaccharide deacetylase family protein [Caenibacillus caldisaponilyticus]|uniref:polysaccharide deacetylase family protein n=1 Tax=Caenibacillus caldisaponilyticus TaxID=1674942 RepID=UPI000988321D|nr:polysaccharide deacetylase family protein [Caenibacillus caldisaponilyticus]
MRLVKITAAVAAVFAVMVFTFSSLKKYESFYLAPLLPERGELSAAGRAEDALYQKIQEFAERRNIPPENARIDPVWKAIPGYNGLKVDVRASYEKMKANGRFDERRLVYKEVPPAVHLKDLPPRPIYRGHPRKPMVAFLINVAWGDEYLPSLIKTLHDYGIHATFFLDGSWTKKHPDLALMIAEEGHEIGNHAYNHPDLRTKSASEVADQLKKTNQAIEAAVHVKPKWFAPPSGSYNQTTVDVAHRLGMRTIMWTVDTVDWNHPEPLAMVRRVARETEAGSMILMHPTDSTAKGLSRLILALKNKGYAMGTVSELLSEKRVDDGKPNGRGEP